MPQLIKQPKTFTDCSGLAIPQGAEAHIAVEASWTLNIEAQYFKAIQILIISLA